MSVQDVIRQLDNVANDPATPAPVVEWLRGLSSQLFDAATPTQAVEDPRFVKGEAMPTAIGPRADLYSEVREKRLAMEKAAAEVKARETEVFNSILSDLNESADTGASGKHHRVQRVMKEVKNVSDWPALWGHIRETGNFEMLQKRLSDGAVKDYAENNGGTLPPGVTATEIPTLSFSKIG